MFEVHCNHRVFYAASTIEMWQIRGMLDDLGLEYAVVLVVKEPS